MYAVPVLHHILQWPADSCQALVIVPTRDLADQVSSTFATLAGNVRIATVAGQRAFERPEDLVADVIVATPGRLVAPFTPKTRERENRGIALDGPACCAREALLNNYTYC